MPDPGNLLLLIVLLLLISGRCSARGSFLTKAIRRNTLAQTDQQGTPEGRQNHGWRFLFGST